MSEHTQAANTGDTPTAYGWCAWHEGNARGVRLIRAIEQGSGPGGNLFACPSCCRVYDLVPFADQPL
jgi:hypothetical protein